MSNLFRLISTHEYFLDINGARRLVRIEVFSAVTDSAILRARVWLQNIYNLYPAVLNTDNSGKDLHSVHSADELNIEISSLVVNDESYLFGRRCAEEQEFLNNLVEMVKEALQQQRA